RPVRGPAARKAARPGAPRPPRPERDAEPVPPERRIAVGRINAVWGLNGFVKVTPLTSNPERLRAGSVVLLGGKPTKILEVVTPQGYPIVRFEGYPDRTSVDRLRETLIEIDERDLPALAEDEYYVDDLVGLEVVTREGTPVGRLTEVLTTGA